MISPFYFVALIGATSACMKTLPGEMMEEPVCDNCSPATELTCPQGNRCDFTLLKRSKNGAKCSKYACKQGHMLAQIGSEPGRISSAVCDRDKQLTWKADTGELLGEDLYATCGFPCSTCRPLLAVETPCPPNYICSITGTADPFVYSMDAQGCLVPACAVGQMFSVRKPVTRAICANGGYLVNGNIVSQVVCGRLCPSCTVPPRDGLTCPDGLVCIAVSKRLGQCSEAYCPAGVMTADGVQVDFLTCKSQGRWEDAAGTVYTAAQCELSCELCAALTNTGMPCPTGLICEVTAERDGQCKETYCPKGQMTGNPARNTLTSLTCNGRSQWIDTQNTVYTSAQCEIPCDQCTPLPQCGSGCPMGFICTPVETQPGQCPSAVCTTGTMKAQPGNVAVTSLTCDGSAQWVDAQKNVYTAAQCETSCTGCTALSNGGMACPKGFVCEVAATRAGQCTETYCPKGQLTGNAARTPLTLLTCDANAQWVDAQAATYTTAQCEIPCTQCPALTNAGMPCLSGFKCTPVLTRNDGQCSEAYCDAGIMTAGSGRTTVTQLTCNGLQQWVDPQMTVYSVAQCETSCTCPPLTITPSPNPIPTRGNALGADAAGCSTIVTRCSRNDLYRLVTADGIVTLEPPAAQSTAMTCVGGKWMATINGVQTVVQEQACYTFPCTTCNNVRTGPGVVTTLAYDPTSFCKQYVLSGCPNGYKVGTTTIGSTLTCSDRQRWSSGSFQGPIGGMVTVNCA
ncbi:hypothetical protein Y032_0053g2419 [Ancylostoma ceylanicum]|uniref:Uncharacterized protein n=2 Tax=Ancylostoma ceylanicum TaxID=53326 RepID=A0A016U8S5_9BILA|nr:hypothetical protein Y032_0053g2419 [Ancylostoma ceylanicum]